MHVANRKVLSPSVTVMHQLIELILRPIVQRLLQRIQDQIGSQSAGDPPAHDPPGIGVDHKRRIGKTPLEDGLPADEGSQRQMRVSLGSATGKALRGL